MQKDDLQHSLTELIARKDSEINSLRRDNERLLAALQPTTDSGNCVFRFQLQDKNNLDRVILLYFILLFFWFDSELIF